jgi:hypothetical protein
LGKYIANALKQQKEESALAKKTEKKVSIIHSELLKRILNSSIFIFGACIIFYCKKRSRRQEFSVPLLVPGETNNSSLR